jgi:hypothetical protein
MHCWSVAARKKPASNCPLDSATVVMTTMSSAVSPPPEDEQGPPETVEPDHVPEYEGFAGPYFQAIGKRKIEERDAKTLVTAEDAETGVGKSNLCDFLGYVCDTSPDGFRERKVAIDPPEFFSKYGVVAKGSSLVLEEGEQLDPRRAMQNENVDASHTWQMERVREIIAFINLPSPKFIDNRMEELADFWINVERRGRARIYKKKIHRIHQSVYYETMQVLEWPNMDGSDTFRRMKTLKQDHIDSDDGHGWVTEEEMQDRIEKAVKNAEQETRNRLLATIYNETELSGPDIARCSGVEISDGRVRQIAREYR